MKKYPKPPDPPKCRLIQEGTKLEGNILFICFCILVGIYLGIILSQIVNIKI